MINKKHLIIAIFAVFALVISLGIGAFDAVSVFAAEGNQGSDTAAYYDGREYASGQVIIVYENSKKAKASAEIIINGLGESGEIPEEQTESSGTDQVQPSADPTATPVPAEEHTSMSIFTRATVKSTHKNMVVVKVEDGVDVAEYIDEAKKQPGVKYAQPNYIYKLAATVSDPIANDNSEGGGWHLYTINAFEAWDYGFGSSDVVIGVIDTGVDLDHTDLAGNIIDDWDTYHHDGSAEAASNEWHGTAVSGFAAAETNQIGLCGVAPQVKLIVVDAYNENTSLFSTLDIIEAIDYLIDHEGYGHAPVDIINLSLGGEITTLATVTDPNPSLTSKIEEAYNAGIVVIAAAGNDNSQDRVYLDEEDGEYKRVWHYPSDISCVISVMASTISDDYLWTGSSYGTAKDITAPGVNLAMTYPDNDYRWAGSGTSFSAPIVAGAAALMLSIDPTLNPSEVAEILYLTAFDTATQKNPGGDSYGAGRLDVYAALQEVSSRSGVTGIEITPEDTLLSFGETEQLVVTLTPSDPYNSNVTFESDDETVATVSALGLITASSSNTGTATITATTEDGGYTDTCVVTVVEAKVNGVSVDAESIHIDISEAYSLTATVTPADATNKNVTFESSDENIATVSASGEVTGVAMGEATITVTTDEGGFTDTCAVEVGYHVTGVTVEGGQIDIGETLQLDPVISPANATNKNVTYESSNELVATVSDTGLVTAVSLGTVTITVTSEDGGIEGTCEVISGYYVESVELTPSSIEVDVDGQETLTTTVLPANATNKAVTYSSSDDAIATVDAVGTVWGWSPGVVTITVTTVDGGKTDTTEVTVIQPVEGVTLSPPSYGMLVGETIQLEAEISPSDATYQGVTYSSDNESVATVDENGLVTSHTLGDAVITVTTDDGGLTDTCDIHVVEELINSSIYFVNRAERFFEDVAIETTVQQIIDSIDITLGTIHVYNLLMEEIPVEGFVSTGYVIRLIVSDTVVDEVTILIEGEVNPDTILDVIDYTLIRLHILEAQLLNGISLEVADVNDDGIIDIIDYTLIRLHILEVDSLYD